MMMRKFKFFEGITDNSYIFHAGFPHAIPVSIGERTMHVASIRNETADDLSYYHAIDAEAELTRLMSEQISEEIDNEMINILTRRINGGHRA